MRHWQARPNSIGCCRRITARSCRNCSPSIRSSICCARIRRTWSAEELVAALRPLTPRLYSIASSQKAVGDEAHLTVAHVSYDAFGSAHWGAASHHLARQEEAGRVPVFIEHNERFRLPRDPSRDVIMIGPGTGVAPFRGFVQERAAIGATGRNWLLFGNPHFRSDFPLPARMAGRAEARADNSLSSIWRSRATRSSKIYVQHHIRTHGAQLYRWIEDGAHLYVCGDATRMARDVHAALIEVAVTQGGKSAGRRARLREPAAAAGPLRPGRVLR